MPIKKSNNYLQFLREAIRISGRTYSEITDLSGGRVTQIPYYLREDSCKLSQACDICEAIGYELTFRLEDDRHLYVAGDNPRVRTGHRLDFLRNELARIGMSQKELASRMGVHSNTLIYNFQVDDMSIPRIFEIACVLQEKLIIDIRQREAEAETGQEGSGCHVVTTITKTVDQYIEP